MVTHRKRPNAFSRQVGCAWGSRARYITQAQLCLFTLFPRLNRPLSATLVNGSYDASAFMLGFIGLFCGQIAGKTDPNHYGYALWALCALGVLHFIVIVFLYPGRPFASLHERFFQSDESAVCTTTDDEETASLLAPTTDQCEKPEGETAATAADTVVKAPEATAAATEEIAALEALERECEDKKNYRFWRAVRTWEYMGYALWFGVGFVTFQAWLVNQMSILSDDFGGKELANVAWALNLLSIPSACVMSWVFESVEPKYKCVWVTSLIGLVFQAIVTSVVDFPLALKWTVYVAMCLFRSGLFSCLWIYFPQVFGYKHLGTLYGFSLLGSTICSHVFTDPNWFGLLDNPISMTLPNSSSKDVLYGLIKKNNLVWFAFLTVIGVLYCAIVWRFDFARRKRFLVVKMAAKLKAP